MPKTKNRPADAELLTLTDVAARTGISMPTLQRYKKDFQDRIPSVGKGRKQRYPADALPVFEQIKQENLKKRGRPRKGRPAAPRKPPAARPTPKPTGPGLLTLTEVAERTGISYPTLVRYVKLHADQIPYEGEGRRRRYRPEAVDVFNRLRSESARGPRKKSESAAKPAATARAPRRQPAPPTAGATIDPSLTHRVAALEQSQQRLGDQIRDVLQLLKQPLTATVNR